MSAHLYQAVLAALLQKAVWSGVRHVVAECLAGDTTLRFLVAQIDHLHSRITERDLHSEDLRLAVESSYGGDLAHDLLVYVEAVGRANPADQHIVREMLARQLLLQASGEILQAENSGRLEIDRPSLLVSRAQELLDGGAAAPTLTFGDFGLPSEVTATAAEEHIPLGISARLDATLGGGLGLGQMVTFLGRPNVGKTSVMVAAGESMLRAGKNVLHIIVGDASAAKITRLYERKALHVKKADWTDDHTRRARELLGAAGGRFWIKDLSGMVVTPDSIESCVRAVQRAEQVPVHCVIIDYLELMEPSRVRSNNRDQIRHAYGQLCKQVRALGPKLGTRIVTAWQVNREGAQKDTSTEFDLSECWDIFKHTDILVVLNRSAGEKANRRMRLTLRKQRSDDESIMEVETFCEWATMTIEDVIQGGPSAIYQERAAGHAAVGVESGPDRGVNSDASGGGISRRPSLSTDGASAGLSQEEGAAV